MSRNQINILPRHIWDVIRFMGCPWPKLCGFQKEVIRKQLDERYCSRCGEYMYNPFTKRKIRHYHHPRKYINLLTRRLRIHPRTHLVEWTRHFPRVMRIIHSSTDIFFYGAVKPRFSKRIPSLRMWSIDEWNVMYPKLYIQEEEGLLRYSKPKGGMDILLTPDLI